MIHVTNKTTRIITTTTMITRTISASKAKRSPAGMPKHTAKVQYKTRRKASHISDLFGFNVFTASSA